NSGHQVITRTRLETVVSIDDIIVVGAIGNVGQVVQSGDHLRGAIERTDALQSEPLIHQGNEPGPLGGSRAGPVARLRALPIATINPIHSLQIPVVGDARDVALPRGLERPLVIGLRLVAAAAPSAPGPSRFTGNRVVGIESQRRTADTQYVR